MQRSLHFYCVSVVNLSFQVIMLLSVKVKNKNGNVIKGWTIITCQEDSTFEDLLHLAHPDLNDGRIYNLVQVKVGKAADSCLNCVQDHLLNVKEVIDMFGLFVEIQVEEEDAVEGTALFFFSIPRWTCMDLQDIEGSTIVQMEVNTKDCILHIVCSFIENFVIYRWKIKDHRSGRWVFISFSVVFRVLKSGRDIGVKMEVKQIKRLYPS